VGSGSFDVKKNAQEPMNQVIAAGLRNNEN